MADPNDLTAELSEFAAERFPGASVEIIGAWVWLTFRDRPADGDRLELKKRGFKWSPRRGQWAHSCGVAKRSRMRGKGHPRDVYGSVRVPTPDSTLSAFVSAGLGEE